MFLRIVAATSAVLLVTLGAASPAMAAEAARVTVETVDLLGKSVAGVEVQFASSADAETVTSDQWGRARARLEVTASDTVTVSIAGDEQSLAAGPDDRLRAELTVSTVLGFEKAWAQADLDGDHVDAYDTVWHQPREGWADRWVVQLTTGALTELRFGGNIVDIFSLNFTDDPANEIMAIEQLASGEYRAWVYSEVANELDRIELGALPSRTFDIADFDGDGLHDMLFTDPNTDGGPYSLSLALSSTQSVQRIELGTEFAYVFGEYVDLTGDGIADIAAAQSIPDVTSRWFIWESESRTVVTTDVGTIGSYASGENFADGDADGLRELINQFPLKTGFTRWEVYEYATGDYFSVVLDDAEFDRGPTPGHYPPSWFE